MLATPCYATLGQLVTRSGTAVGRIGEAACNILQTNFVELLFQAIR
jgi:hypothetical protein